MKRGNNTYGMTLTELLVVIAVMAILVGIGVTATKAVLESFESSTNVKRVISAALSNARAIAMSNKEDAKYAGVRFQQDKDGNHYLIFIIHDKDQSVTGLANGFYAVPGKKPVRLPKDVGFIDLIVRQNHGSDIADAEDTSSRPVADADLNDNDVTNLDANGNNMYLVDACTFSIVFSSAGKLVVHEVRARNHDAVSRPVDVTESRDDVFNSYVNVESDVAMFVQDDYADMGLGEEFSRTSFIVYEKKDFEKIDVSQRLSGFLQNIEACYLSPYTGQIVIEQ